MVNLQSFKHLPCTVVIDLLRFAVVCFIIVIYHSQIPALLENRFYRGFWGKRGFDEKVAVCSGYYFFGNIAISLLFVI